MSTAVVEGGFVSSGIFVRSSRRGRTYRFVVGVFGLIATALALFHPNRILVLDALDLAQASFWMIFGPAYLGSG